ncbi:hypothetical protein BC829DRAFT_93957 [Chytridium lagenaria]|nr:hypothetical protein BC829DRAFT_93957 [Chytridium lagenaria]
METDEKPHSPRKPRTTPSLPHANSVPSLHKRGWGVDTDPRPSSITTRRVSGGGPLLRAPEERASVVSMASRSNSTPSLRPSMSAPALNKGRAAMASARRALREQYETLLSCRNPTERELRESLRKMRKMVLTDGIPDLDEPSSLSKPTVCSLRGKIWKALLGIYRVSGARVCDAGDEGTL